jgi:hypothetical protein
VWEKILRLGRGCFVCVLGAERVSGCVLASVWRVLACASMLFAVRFYVGWRDDWMLLVSAVAVDCSGILMRAFSYILVDSSVVRKCAF